MEGGTTAGTGRDGTTPAVDRPDPVLTLTVPADPGQLAPTRERLRGWLHAHGVDEWDVETVLIATGEACANAIEHGYRFASGGITILRAELRDDRLEIEVRDHGGWRDDAGDDGIDRGRGRLIMARVMDEAAITGTPEGTTVRMIKRLTSVGCTTADPAGREDQL
ncbi:ATP-binding protein [Micromonospora sp. NPDC005806]|uniref:ATP-binding protein n=1 Tax=Micromonospora sp. NPDC005806 TaxID=3364234 RepID=UPI0036777855